MKKTYGFTIIELLVVIVVIGILAAITITSYSGIQQKATIASLQSDLNNAAKQLKLNQITDGTYPVSLSAANGGKGIPSSPGTTYQYATDNSTNPPSFCITATKGTTTYKLTNDSPPVAGDCLDYGLALRFDIANPLSYPGSGNTLTDLSGNNNVGTLFNGVGFNGSAGGSLIFDGVNDYVNSGNSPSLDIKDGLSVLAWVNFTTLDYVNSTGILNTIAAKGAVDRLTPHSGWWFVYDNRSNRKSFSYTCFGNTNGGYSGGGNNFSPNLTNPTIQENTWHQLAITVSSTEARLFMDGIQQGATRTILNGSMSDNSRNLYIGTTDSVNNFFKGGLSRFEVYKRVLGVSEVQQSFTTLKNRYGL